MLAKEDDSASDESDNSYKHNPILWKFSELLANQNSKEDIIKRIHEDGRYAQLTDKEFIDLTDDFSKILLLVFRILFQKVEIQQQYKPFFQSCSEI